MNGSSMGYPGQRGMYSPAFEHDACGIGMIVDIAGRRSHEIVTQALSILRIWSTGAERAQSRTRATARAS